MIDKRKASRWRTHDGSSGKGGGITFGAEATVGARQEAQIKEALGNADCSGRSISRYGQPVHVSAGKGGRYGGEFRVGLNHATFDKRRRQPEVCRMYTGRKGIYAGQQAGTADRVVLREKHRFVR